MYMYIIYTLYIYIYIHTHVYTYNDQGGGRAAQGRDRGDVQGEDHRVSKQIDI